MNALELRAEGTRCKALEHWCGRIPHALRHDLGSLVWGHTQVHSGTRRDGKQDNRESLCLPWNGKCSSDPESSQSPSTACHHALLCVESSGTVSRRVSPEVTRRCSRQSRLWIFQAVTPPTSITIWAAPKSGLGHQLH